ncbi:MAG: PfkB family carbohydrate kinase [Planctomycetota bacterium]|jgi:ribokinase|nr:PfkB family carbohydrate kinase [Planctomycetota bacterium]
MTSSSAAIDILGAGIAAVDDLFLVKRFPRPNEKFAVISRTRQGGGLTATALVAASRLGCCCHCLITLGADDLSGFLRNTLSREGIVLHERPGLPDSRPNNPVVITEQGSGDRFIMWSEENIYGLDLVPDDFDALTRSKCLFVDNVYAESAVPLARKARELGIPAVGDFEDTGERVRELISLTGHLIMPIAHAAQLTGEADPGAVVKKLMREPGRELACVTDSERGAWFADAADPENIRHQPAFIVQNVVDTCGCGDVFHGAYAACLVFGLPPSERIRRAAAAGALKAMRQGSQMGAPTAAELDAFLAANG